MASCWGRMPARRDLRILRRPAGRLLDDVMFAASRVLGQFLQDAKGGREVVRVDPPGRSSTARGYGRGQRSPASVTVLVRSAGLVTLSRSPERPDAGEPAERSVLGDQGSVTSVMAWAASMRSKVSVLPPVPSGRGSRVLP